MKSLMTPTVTALRRQVADKERRRSPDGKALHACCLCDTVAPWGPEWRWYGSDREEEDGVPVMKFCPSHVGPNVHELATAEMANEAFLKEYR